ncbi:glycosyltransferase [Patescibacteria group bacterium]|nr:glycosyltransferase [Patescibacteria group bacterium]
MLTPYLPYPLLSGGQTRSYNLIKNLSGKHEITLFSLIKHESEKKYVGELKKYCKKVKVFKRSQSPWTLRNIVLTGFGPYPFLVIRNLVQKEREAIKKELSTDKYDLIHAETFYVMPHIPRTEIPVLLVEQTVEYLVYKHYVEERAPLFMRPLLWIDIFKLRFWETYYWKRAKKVVAMSDSDKRQMRELVHGLDIDVVPNGIDIDYFSEKERKEAHPQRILYVGNFSWLQNIEAVEILTSTVWTKIKKEIPKAKLWIVGMNMTDEIRALQEREDIEITEGIPDIRDAYRKASVLVAPIEGPGGTRLKVLEAMASGLPVVTTPVGAEGLGVKDGKHVLIKSNYKELATSAVKVLKNEKLAKNLGESGKKFVEKNYSWSTNAGLLDKIYKEVIRVKA